MIGRNFILKNTKNFFKHNAKISQKKIPSVTEKSSKNEPKKSKKKLSYDVFGHVQNPTNFLRIQPKSKLYGF